MFSTQFQKTSAKTRQCRQERIRIRASDFGLLSDFGFRVSDFCPVVSVTLRAESMLPTTNVEEPNLGTSIFVLLKSLGDAIGRFLIPNILQFPPSRYGKKRGGPSETFIVMEARGATTV